MLGSIWELSLHVPNLMKLAYLTPMIIYHMLRENRTKWHSLTWMKKLHLWVPPSIGHVTTWNSDDAWYHLIMQTGHRLQPNRAQTWQPHSRHKSVWHWVPRWKVTPLTANMIAQAMYAQFDVDKSEYLLLECFVDVQKDPTAISLDYQKAIHNGREHLCCTTVGWHVCCQGKDRSWKCYQMWKSHTPYILLSMLYLWVLIMTLVLTGGYHTCWRSAIPLLPSSRSIVLSTWSILTSSVHSTQRQ